MTFKGSNTFRDVLFRIGLAAASTFGSAHEDVIGFGTIWAKSKSCIANSMDTNAGEVFVNCKKVFQNLELSLYVQLPVGSMERFPVATIRGTRLAVNLRGLQLALR
jgi:hypothetical protein